MSDPLEEHFGYLADKVKIDRYEAAIGKVVRPGHVVLDLGCGSGLLGLMALRAGAAKVLFVEEGAVIEMARRTVEKAGFGDRAEFARVTAGRPYRLYTITPTDLAGTAPLADRIRPMPRWRVPLLVDGEARALVGVERRGATYEATDLGAAGLARELSALEQTLAAAPESPPRAILRLFQLQSDFLFTPGTPAATQALRLHPLTSARRRLGLATADTPGGVALSRLQPALRQAIQRADTRRVRP